MAILTTTEYNTRRELTETSPERDEAVDAAILSAEDAVLKYTGRDFTTAPAPETREYTYDGSGILETDDFTKLTSLSAAGTTISAQAASPGPREGETFYWIDFTAVPRESPMMGFTRNLDTIFARYPCNARPYVTVSVTATFGWPGDAPASVKQAVVWLVDEFVKSQGTQGDVQSEAIADLSYVYQRMGESSSLPGRIQQLLDPYRRVSL